MHTHTHANTQSTVVGVPASRAGPPDNGGSLFIYPSMRADTTDRLPFIGKSFLIPQMSGALNRRGHRVSLRARATRASISIDIGREEEGGRVEADVSLDNCGDRLYFVYTREHDVVVLPPSPPPLLLLLSFPIVDILLDRERTAFRTRPRDAGARVHAKSKSRVN